MAGDVTDRCIEPDVEILSRVAGYLEAKIGSVSTDIPVLKTRIDPFSQLVGHGWLQVVSRHPSIEQILKGTQREEQVVRCFLDRLCSRERRYRINKLHR